MTTEDREIEREKDREWDFKEGLNYPHDYVEEYPQKDVDIQEYYYDQAPRKTDLRSIGGPTITSFFLPYGIKQMDHWMCKQIIYGSKFNKEELTKMIKHNFHLHNVIKTNLLINLKNKI